MNNLFKSLYMSAIFRLEQNKTVKITPSTPRFYLYEFAPNVSSILLHVESKDDLCMIVSIQNISCPVFDLERNVQYEGLFQTVTRRGGLTITVSLYKYRKHSFMIIFLIVINFTA